MNIKSKAICTIVAKNYFASALTLGNSLKKNNNDVDFYIIIADTETDEFNQKIKGIDFKVIYAKDLNIEGFNDLAYKYDITEFATSLKPFLLDYLLLTYNYVIYLDPDIYVFDSLNDIFDKLEDYSIILTPHIIDNDINCTNINTERTFLFSGLYNLGFVGFSNSNEGKNILLWWKNRLRNNCYIDHHTNLFTDQKWMDLIPVLFDKTYILKNKRYNVAWWNYAERDIIISSNNELYVISNNLVEKIVFFHFSGFNIKDTGDIGRYDINIDDNKRKTIKKIYDFYRSKLIENNYSTYIKTPYGYAYYENGIIITRLQRRIYRTISDNDDLKFSNPFSTIKGSYYDKLRKNQLLVKTTNLNYNFQNGRNMPNLNNKVRKMQKLFLIIKKLIGIKNYSYLMRYLDKMCNDENQSFLLKNKN